MGGVNGQVKLVNAFSKTKPGSFTHLLYKIVALYKNRIFAGYV